MKFTFEITPSEAVELFESFASKGVEKAEEIKKILGLEAPEEKGESILGKLGAFTQSMIDSRIKCYIKVPEGKEQECLDLLKEKGGRQNFDFLEDVLGERGVGKDIWFLIRKIGSKNRILYATYVDKDFECATELFLPETSEEL